MNRKILILSFMLLIVAFFSSCSKEGGKDNPGDEGGKLTISFGFDSSGPETMATQSTAKPTTSWKENIKDLLILFVDPHGKVSDARNIDVPQVNDILDKKFVFTNLVANKTGEAYTVYLVANSQQTAINANGGWNASNCKGRNISTLLMDLVVNPAFTQEGGADDGASGFLEPAEIFLASKTNVEINPDANTDLTGSPFTLTRAISLLRVRINQSKNGNDVIDFKQGNASFRIRRASNNLTVDGAYTRGDGKSMIYMQGAFDDQEPTAGYAGGTILDIPNKFTLWKDIKMFPGGSTTTGSQKFDVVLVGYAPAGYVALGQKTLPAGGGDVAWGGAVNEIAAANGILEINLTLESAGKWVDDPTEPGIPEPGQYGSIEIKVNVADWGTITSLDIPL